MLSVDRAGLFFIYHIVLILYTPIYILFLVVSRIQTRITNTIAYLSYMAYIKLTHYVSIERVHYCILMVIKVDRVGCWSLEWIQNSTTLWWFKFQLIYKLPKRELIPCLSSVIMLKYSKKVVMAKVLFLYVRTFECWARSPNDIT